MIVRHPNPVANALNDVLPEEDWFIEGDGETVAYAYNGDFRDTESDITRSIEIRNDGTPPWEAALSIPGPRGHLEPCQRHAATALEAIIDWAADHQDDEV